MALRGQQKLQEDKHLLQERLGSLQRALAQLESEKREAERSSLRLEKDKTALKKTLDKVSWSFAYLNGPAAPSEWPQSLLTSASGLVEGRWLWAFTSSVLSSLLVRVLLDPGHIMGPRAAGSCGWCGQVQWSPKSRDYRALC